MEAGSNIGAQHMTVILAILYPILTIPAAKVTLVSNRLPLARTAQPSRGEDILLSEPVDQEAGGHKIEEAVAAASAGFLPPVAAHANHFQIGPPRQSAGPL